MEKAFREAGVLAGWVRRKVRGGSGEPPIRIVAYRGHGTRDVLYLKGRVLRGEPIPQASEHDNALRNLLHSVRRLNGSGVPAVRIRAHVGGESWETVSDREGAFELVLQIRTPAAEREVWREIDIELAGPAGRDESPRTVGYALIPARTAAFGVISDVDDTVVKTNAANLLSMLRLVLLTNARTRLPFDGVAAFYRALARGPAGEPVNPIFYVSSSPWSLSDLLQEVFQVHGVPAGPLFLRDYGLDPQSFAAHSHRGHKLRAIEHILATHSQLRFILLGDSGQQDPEIYREAVRRHPGRIRALYIRNVTPGPRDAEITAMARELRDEGVDLISASDTLGLATRAAEDDLIDDGVLAEIRGERGAG